MTDHGLHRLLNDRLDWNLLRTFRVIGQELSISRAAARLHLTQPAVTQALKRLEEQLGRQLIARRGPRFALTETGEQIFALAGELYGQISQVSSMLDRSADEVIGKVRLLIISRIVCEGFDDFLADFHRQHPRVDVEIDVMRSSDIISALLEKTATLGLSLNRRAQPRLEQRLFLRQRYAFFCGKHHALLGRQDIAQGDLQKENFVSFTSDQIGGMLSPLTIFYIIVADRAVSIARIDDLVGRLDQQWEVGTDAPRVCKAAMALRTRSWPRRSRQAVRRIIGGR